MAGRGAWNVDGVGGTKQYRQADQPGPYYFTGSGYKSGSRTPNEYAVYAAVKAYQRALNAAGITCLADGLYGPATTKAMLTFQQRKAAAGAPVTPWGGIGPETSELLLRPVLDRVVATVQHHKLVTAKVVSGVVRTESLWDAGAVGAADERDVGLAQINAEAHPEWDTAQRLTPAISFEFVLTYLTASLNALGGSLRDAAASYNLGVGGTRAWIKAGRPDTWTPAGTGEPRQVRRYIDKILAG